MPTSRFWVLAITSRGRPAACVRFATSESRIRQSRLEHRLTLGAQADDTATVWIVVDQAFDTSVLPDRQPGTGGAPRVEDFGVRSRFIRDPLQELQREGGGWFRHGLLFSCVKTCVSVA